MQKRATSATKIASRQGAAPNMFLPAAKSPRYKTDARVCARASRQKFDQAFFTVSTRAAKLLGSLMAISDSILRFSSMPAFFRPAMKEE